MIKTDPRRDVAGYVSACAAIGNVIRKMSFAISAILFAIFAVKCSSCPELARNMRVISDHRGLPAQCYNPLVVHS